MLRTPFQPPFFRVVYPILFCCRLRKVLRDAYHPICPASPPPPPPSCILSTQVAHNFSHPIFWILVPFGTCICSNVETILSWTCHVYGPFEVRTSLGTSILLAYMYLSSKIHAHTCICMFSRFIFPPHFFLIDTLIYVPQPLIPYTYPVCLVLIIINVNLSFLVSLFLTSVAHPSPYINVDRGVAFVTDSCVRKSGDQAFSLCT